MTITEFDLFLQQLPYFYQQHGVTSYVPPEDTNEKAYELFQFRAWSSNIKTHRLERVWSNARHKDFDYEAVFDMEEELLAIAKQINPDNQLFLRAEQFLVVYGTEFIGKNYKYYEFVDKMFDDVMDSYLTHEDQTHEEVNNYLLNLLLDNEHKPLLEMLWKYITNIKM